MSEPLVVVTGSGSGIGRATALAFEAAGHPVVGLTLESGVDVTDYAAAEGAIRAAEADHGPTGCLVNCAGTLDASEFDAADPERFAREVEINLLGTMNCSRAVVDGMLAAGGGTIVNVSSVSDRRPGPAALGYTASKHGVRGFGESLRLAYGMRGLRVVNLAPGYVRTAIHEGMGISFDEYSERLGNPDFMSAEQVAETILWCWRLPPEVCVRDLEIAPTRTSF